MNNSIIDDYLNEIYEYLENKKTKYGEFHKTLFHIHTPASFDYQFMSNFDDKGRKYRSKKESEIYQIAVDNNLFPKDFLPLEDVDYDTGVFENKKEYLTYLLTAKKLADNKIGLVIIADHNTVEGFHKLKRAIEVLNESIKCDVYTEVVLGIEISCADKIHVVGIFDKDKFVELKEWINNNIMSDEDGTFMPSLMVLEEIFKLEGLGYVAHLNSSDIFKKEKFLTGTYKNKLFSSQCLMAIGVSDIDKIEIVSQKLEVYEREFFYIVDSDTHCIDEFDKNIVFVKGQTRNFKMLASAFRDNQVAVQLERQASPRNYIRCIAIDSGEKGFLKNKIENKLFIASFSEYLNCLIGGRGTGKSTILQMINFVLTQNIQSKEMLELICRHNEIMLIIHYEDSDYLVCFHCPNKEDDRDILKYFYEESYNNYRHLEKYSFDKFVKTEVGNYAIKNFINVFRIDFVAGKPIKTYENNKILKMFFKTDYSTHNLVNIASTNEISTFLEDVLTISNRKPIIKGFDSPNKLIKSIKNLEISLDRRKKKVLSSIENFNISQEHNLKISYDTKSIEFEQFNFKEILDKKGEYYFPYNITIEATIGYLHRLGGCIGYIKTFELFEKSEYEKLDSILPIEDFCEEEKLSIDQINLQNVSPKNKFMVLGEIRKDIFSSSALNDYYMAFCKYIKDDKFEDYNLELNINNRAKSSNINDEFKKVRQLSLGQKVVAMLSFVLSYGKFSADHSPLLLDQPEDNLDNQYIYDTLVKTLKETRDNRQVIIATHNSTIVTNAKAEQVIVLESDGTNAWKKSTGYPTERIILNHIVNYLEGGIPSFKHKAFLYEEILK